MPSPLEIELFPSTHSPLTIVFASLRYQDAALTFSQSQLSFEEVTLKFIQVNKKDALKTFLLKKLESLGEKVGCNWSQ